MRAATLALFLILLLFTGTAYAAGNTTTVPKKIFEKHKPEPTLDLNDTSIWVVFRFGAWVRVAYNNSKVVAPVAVYVYSRNDFPVSITCNYNKSWQGYWGLALNLSKLDLNKPLILNIRYKDKEYTLRFNVVKIIEEKEKEKIKGPVFVWSQVKEWLDREAQAAGLISLFAIAAAFTLKRKLLLIRVFNGFNIAVIIIVSGIIWLVAPRINHSEWLALPFILSYIAAYKVTPAGRKIYLIKIIPSMRKILWETAVLYRTVEGRMAYAKQTLGEAIKRLFGKHILIKDAETGKTGEIPSDKFWTVEDVEFYEKSDALLVLDALLTKERVVENKQKEMSIYE